MLKRFLESFFLRIYWEVLLLKFVDLPFRYGEIRRLSDFDLSKSESLCCSKQTVIFGSLFKLADLLVITLTAFGEPELAHSA